MYSLRHYFDKTYNSRRETTLPRVFKTSHLNKNVAFKGDFNRAGKSNFLPDNTHWYYVHFLGRLPDELSRLTEYVVGTWVSVAEINRFTTPTCADYLVFNDLGEVMNLDTTYIFKGWHGECYLAVRRLHLGHAAQGAVPPKSQVFENRTCYLVSQLHRPVITKWDSRNARVSNLTENLTTKDVAFVSGRLQLPVTGAARPLAITGDWYYDKVVTATPRHRFHYKLNELRSFTITKPGKLDTDYYLIHVKDTSFGLITDAGLSIYIFNTKGEGFRLLRLDESDFITLSESYYGLRIARIQEMTSSNPALLNKVATIEIQVSCDAEPGHFLRADSNYRHVLENLPVNEASSLIVGDIEGPTCWMANTLYKDSFLDNCFLFNKDEQQFTGLGAFGYTYTSHLMAPATYKFPADEQPSPNEYHSKGTLFITNQDGTIDGITPANTEAEVVNRISLFDVRESAGLTSSLGKGTIAAFDNKNVTPLRMQDTQYDFAYYDRSTKTLHVLTDEEVSTGQYVVLHDGVADWALSTNRYDLYSRPRNNFTGINSREPNFQADWDFGVYWGDETHVPFKDAVVIVNGQYFINGIDYIQNQSGLMICSKMGLLTDRLDRPTDMAVILLAGGAQDKDAFISREVGFVKHGVIGLDTPWKLRQWRNATLVINGKVRRITDVTPDPIFASNGHYNDDHALNGVPFEYTERPYLLRPSEVNTGSYTGWDTAKQEAEVNELAVTKYMREHHPISIPSNPSMFDALYRLYSPFMHRVLIDMGNGELNITFQDVELYGLDALLGPYLHLLPLDPCVTDNAIDWNICTVDAHRLIVPVTITADQYSCLAAINNHYLGDHVDLTRLLRVRPQ